MNISNIDKVRKDEFKPRTFDLTTGKEITDESDEQITPKPPRLKYDDFRKEQYEPIGDLWDESIPLSHNLTNIIKEAVILPYSDVQLPIVVAYAMIPSAMASIVPVLFLQGDKGSGKSTLSELIAAVHDSQIQSAATTFAAIRNYYNQIKWEYPELCIYEKNCCLLFDNVNKETLADEGLYTLLLNGYNRKTDKMSISKGNGENIDFRVFGSKVLSSIHPLYTQSRFAELSRRLLIIKCKPFEKFNLAERKSLNDMDSSFRITDKLDIEGIDLSILHTSFTEFWKNEQRLTEYAALRRLLSGRKKSLKLPAIFDGARWTISIDLIVTGVITQVWDSYDTAIAAVAKYWEWHKNNIMNGLGAAHKILKDFIADELTQVDKANKEFGYEALPKEINPEKLKKHISYASTAGMLDISPTPSNIADVMADLGWMLDKGSKGQICWVQTLR